MESTDSYLLISQKLKKEEKSFTFIEKSFIYGFVIIFNYSENIEDMFLFTVEIDEERFRKLVDSMMALRNSLLNRLKGLRHTDFCDSRVRQRENLLKFRDALDNLLLSLVSNTDFTGFNIR